MLPNLLEFALRFRRGRGGKVFGHASYTSGIIKLQLAQNSTRTELHLPVRPRHPAPATRRGLFSRLRVQRSSPRDFRKHIHTPRMAGTLFETPASTAVSTLYSPALCGAVYDGMNSHESHGSARSGRNRPGACAGARSCQDPRPHCHHHGRQRPMGETARTCRVFAGHTAGVARSAP